MKNKKSKPQPKPRVFLRKSSDADGKILLYTENLAAKDTKTLFTTEPIQIKKGIGEGEHIVILGGGIAGLTVAYELLKLKEAKFKVTILEARDRLGGRSITLRRGDKIVEEVGNKKHEQVCTFKCEPGKPEPYLNAGPGRIPSGHRNVLNYCKELNVELEPYIMESRSNIHLIDPNAGTPTKPILIPEVNRRITNDFRGHIAEKLHLMVDKMDDLEKEEKENFKEFLRHFGDLDEESRKYILPEPKLGLLRRNGFKKLPTLQPGEYAPILSLKELLNQQYWKGGLYQPEDWLWQQTSFQPVGGMDMIVKAFEREISCLGGQIKVNAPVTNIQKIENKWVISYGHNEAPIIADICISNIPMPLLDGLVNLEDFSADYAAALKRVFSPEAEFLQPSTKVGWQAKRELWQNPKDKNEIPIYGGISRTTLPMTQMWYPSDRIHDEYGVLTGAYNYRGNAENWGKMTPAERIKENRDNIRDLHGDDFADGLEAGITVAWHNIPYIKGAWPNWAGVTKLEEEQPHIEKNITYNQLLRGDNNFYTCGDQNSQFPGWKEGAIQSALSVVGQITEFEPYLSKFPEASHVPNTNALVQGSYYEE